MRPVQSGSTATTNQEEIAGTHADAATALSGYWGDKRLSTASFSMSEQVVPRREESNAHPDQPAIERNLEMLDVTTRKSFP
jgi:hypothetical protein